MTEYLTNIGAIVVVFGLVIFVHEAGHFMAAKLMGVYAPRFSIGFGPALWRKRWGETEYILAALPLGGYVRMASREDQATAFLEGGGETPPPEPHTVGASGEGKLFEEERVAGHSDDYDPEAMVPFGPKPVPEHRWFESKGLPARIFILLAGVTMNVVLALVLMIAVIAIYGVPFDPTVRVGATGPVYGSGPVLAGLEPGDSIVAVNGTPVRRWIDIDRAIASGSGDAITFTLPRGEVRVPIGGEGQPSRQDVLLTLSPFAPPVIDTVHPDTPADRAGVEAGDSIVAVDDEPVVSWQQLVQRIAASPGRELTISLVRDGELRSLVVVPDSVRETVPSGERMLIGQIGAGPPPRQLEREHVAFPQAVQLGWTRTWRMTTFIVDFLGQLVRREVGADNLGGPIAIGRVAAQAAQAGMETFLSLIALLSVNIAIFNLLPIPILDGGQILLNVAESIKGSAFSARTREYILRAGLAAIALLFIFVMFNDIRNWIRDLL
jgi:regulator of sigma E protease